MGRKDRLKEVYDYVRKHFPIHTQDDFADSLKYNRAYISSAMNGNEKYLTDSLFKNICESYPDVFNLEYLLTGDGILTTNNENITNPKRDEILNQKQEIDQSSLINAALAAKDETISAKQEIIEQLQQRLVEKDELISLLRARVYDLQRLSSLTTQSDPIRKYPFEIGVAESDERPRL